MTGVQTCALPSSQVRPRSGVTSKTKLRVQLGTIDNAYKGEIGVIVDNIGVKEICDLDLNSGTVEYCEPSYPYLLNGTISDDWEDYTGTPKPTYKIRKGDRIAQLVVQALPEVTAVEIEEFTEALAEVNFKRFKEVYPEKILEISKI